MTHNLELGSPADDSIQMIEYENGDKYEGQLKNGLRHGMGKLTYNDDINRDVGVRDYYIGQWADNNRHGLGSIFFKNSNEKYAGDWVNDKSTGLGYYEWDNGDIYHGDNVDGIEHIVSSVNKFYEILNPPVDEIASIYAIYKLPLPIELKRIICEFSMKRLPLFYRRTKKKNIKKIL